MLIQEMTIDECRDALAHAKVARLVCEMDDQPYAVPVYLTYDGTDLFGFATMGLKIDCMRDNPLVCVEIDDIKSQNQWTSVVVFGKYEELPDTPEYETTRAHAHHLLQERAMWWEPASVAVEHGSFSKQFSPIFYRIRIDRMTGRRASPDPAPAHPAGPAGGKSWLSKLLDRIIGK
jgi:nitroimidazol reductase NimA-like FMN-containing flavoprotein (pyridoxamine 5'-phosphate oxidase superfamily)